MKRIALLCLLVLLFNCNSNAQDTKKDKKVYEITKTEAQWKKDLSKNAFYVLRKAGTERPFSSKLNKEYSSGTYVCAACQTPLFKSDNKFDSGTGWPSFDKEIKGSVDFSVDYNLGHARTEEHCGTCGGHLGHVFNDGPSDTTGKRHCINGVSLKFIPQK